MKDVAYQEIYQEFRRQVGLCSGLGRRKMLEIVKSHEFAFENGEQDEGRAKERDLNGPRWGKVGRNDPCMCGSGMKYKRCCYLSR